MINNELGTVKVSREVVETIVKLAAAEIESVSNFSQKGEKKIHTKSPKIEIQDDNVKINIYISLYYGNDIKKEVEKIQENIINSVNTMLGLNVVKVNVYVYDITPKEEN